MQDGHQELSYALDEGLIEFRTAIDDGDYLRAMNYLEVNISYFFILFIRYVNSFYVKKLLSSNAVIGTTSKRE